jgi:hypothetical protein
MSFRKYIPILLMVLGIATTACIAQTWDATRDFAASNPNGAWSYGYGVTGTSFVLYPIYSQNCGIYVEWNGCWATQDPPSVPYVGFNTTGNWLNDGTSVLPPNVLLMHPAPDWEPADSIVQWTAPIVGTYRISGFFEILDTNPSGIIGMVFRNGTLLFKAELLGPPAQHPDRPGGRVNFYFPEVSLNAGDVISFGLNADGTFYYDTTGFNATIVTPPNAPPCALCSE